MCCCIMPVGDINMEGEDAIMAADSEAGVLVGGGATCLGVWNVLTQKGRAFKPRRKGRMERVQGKKMKVWAEKRCRRGGYKQTLVDLFVMTLLSKQSIDYVG